MKIKEKLNRKSNTVELAPVVVRAIKMFADVVRRKSIPFEFVMLFECRGMRTMAVFLVKSEEMKETILVAKSSRKSYYFQRIVCRIQRLVQLTATN